jgi:phosphotransferase system enzyme I (PtsI)
MARSLRIPAVVGLKDASSKLQSGQYALVDGFNGLIIINPTDQTLYERPTPAQASQPQRKLQDTILKPAVTLDGHRVVLSANIDKAADSEDVRANGAEGVGLFRTEYLFMNRETTPTEEQQYESCARPPQP